MPNRKIFCMIMFKGEMELIMALMTLEGTNFG